MREDNAVCLGLDRQVDTGIIDSEGVDVDNTFSHSDSGTMFMHEDASEGAEADVRLGVIRRITSSSGTRSVHKGKTGREVKEINRIVSDLESKTRSVHEEGTSEVVGGMDNGVIEGMVLGSGSGLSSVAEGAGMYRNLNARLKMRKGVEGLMYTEIPKMRVNMRVTKGLTQKKEICDMCSEA